MANYTKIKEMSLGREQTQDTVRKTGKDEAEEVAMKAFD